MTDRKLFGTNGIRGIINETLTVDLVLDMGKAIGTILGPGKIVVGRDARQGGEMFSRSVTSGLLSTGCSVIDVDLVPTPTLQFFIAQGKYNAGVVVTASHNPAQFNGIKVIGNNGIEISRSVEDEIEACFVSKNFRLAEWSNIGSLYHDMRAIQIHLDGVKSHVDMECIRKRKYTVAIDSANSVGALVTPILMRDFGCKVVSLNSQLDGTFPGRSPEPIPENIKELCQVVKSIRADIGIAHDGDADRATFVDEHGTVVSGDQSLAIIAKRIVSQKLGSILVTPVSSGCLIEDVVKQAGGTIEWTTVGSVDVSHRIEEIGAELGGEENGGVFYPPHQSVRDGVMTAALIVEIMAKEEKSLSDLTQELPVYYTTKRKMEIPRTKMESVLSNLLSLTEKMNRITIDGIKIIKSNGWILIRPSGTEPIYRCFSESRTQEESDAYCTEGVNLIEKALSLS